MGDRKSSCWRWWLVTLTEVLLAAACVAGPAPVAPGATSVPAQPLAAAPLLEPTSVIVDTDMGADDVMAILYLLKRPDVALKAITVAGTGLAHCEPGTRNALALLARAGAPQIPVACGREQPLQGERYFPPDWRAAADSMYGLQLMDAGQPAADGAVGLLSSTIPAAPRPAVLLALGPLTNVAEALQNHPALAGNLERIVVMGGAIGVPGNVMGVPLSAPNTAAEFNMFVDPHAGNIVFRSGAPVTLVPLDATNQVPINRYIYRALKAHHDTRGAEILYDLFSVAPSLYGSGQYFWDALAAAISVDGSLARLETLKLRVVEQEGTDIGRTLVADDGMPVQVALSADAQRFEAEFLSRLNGGAAITIERIPPPPKAALAITQAGDNCTLAGPKTVPAGEISIDWTVDKTHDGHGLAILTLNEGKSFADLDAWSSSDKPPWAQEVAYLVNEDPGSRSIETADVEKGPVYIVCFTAFPVTKVGTLGPIEVTPD